MGYERNDRGYGRDQYGARDQQRDYRRDPSTSYGRDRDDRDYGRQPQGHDYDDRGFFDRAGDEVRSWFGDDEAERRRRFDERTAERDYNRSGGDRDRYRPSAGQFAGRDQDRGPSYGGGVDNARDLGAPATSATESDRASWTTDQGYRSWRDRQMAQFDRDYEDYRREHQSKFEQEFHGWRQTRQGQRDQLTKVQEHQEVVGSDGQHVGKVDKVRGDRIILTKGDTDAGGHHHSIPSSWIKSIDDKVTISKTAEEAKAHWRDEERNSAIRANDRAAENRDQAGAHNLNRSFSGTY